MFTVTTMERVFHFEQQGENTIILNDPDVTLTPGDVMDLYALTYPILTTAQLEGPYIEDDQSVYKFRSTLGTKG